MPPNQSLAPQLLQEAGVFDRTLGVFTKGDKVAADHVNDLSRDAVVDSLIDATSPGSIKNLARGWVMCCNVGLKTEQYGEPASNSGSKEMLRMHAMRAKEDKIIAEMQTIRPETKQRCGMPSVIQRTQAFFEAFLMQNWVPSIHKQMSERFEDSLQSLCFLGVPIPNSPAYQLELTQLRREAPAVVKSFDSRILVTTTHDDVFKRMVMLRVNKLLAGDCGDWMKLKERPNILESIAAIDSIFNLAIQRWTQPQPFMKASEDAAQVKKQVVATCRRIIDAIEEFSVRSPRNLCLSLSSALFCAPPAAPAGLFTIVKEFFVFGFAAFANSGNDDQAALTQLNRKPQLKAEFERYLDTFLPRLTAEFVAKANALVTAELEEYVVQKILTAQEQQQRRLHASTDVFAQIELLRPNATKVLGHRIFGLFMNDVVQPLATLTKEWNVPPTAFVEDKATQEARKAELSRMLVSVTVLRQLNGMLAAARL